MTRGRRGSLALRRRALPSPPSCRFIPALSQRQADALVELAERSLRAGDLPEQGGERPTLVLTMPYAKLAEQVGTGILDTGEHLPASTVRRMACDAKIIPVVLGSEGQPLDIGRANRTIP